MRREEQDIFDGIYLYIPGIFPDHYGTTSTNFGIFIVNDYPYPYPPTAEYRVIITDTLGSYDYPTGIPVWLSNVYDSGGIGRVYSIFVENWDVVHPLIKAMVLKYVVCPYCGNTVNSVFPQGPAYETFRCRKCRFIFNWKTLKR
ncbi:MAG: hypothetical protein Q7U34_10180 [Anaerolineales bacterium]|nr:hypothetical protein [Anaerolineales bacterium]